MRDSSLVLRSRFLSVVAFTDLLLGVFLSPFATPAEAQRRPEPILEHNAAAVSQVSTLFVETRGASLQPLVTTSGFAMDIGRRIASRRRYVTIGAAIGAYAALSIVERRNNDDGPGSLTDLWDIVPGALAGALRGTDRLRAQRGRVASVSRRSPSGRRCASET